MVALQHAGLYDSPVEAQTFFKSVNKEIDNAHLPQSKGFTPTKLLPKKLFLMFLQHSETSLRLHNLLY